MPAAARPVRIHRLNDAGVTAWKGFRKETKTLETEVGLNVLVRDLYSRKVATGHMIGSVPKEAILAVTGGPRPRVFVIAGM